MDFLGPVGLTLAAAFLMQHVSQWVFARRVRGHQTLRAYKENPGDPYRTEAKLWTFDYRFIALGIFLPDVIDKTLAFWIAPGLVNHSLRSVGHSIIGVASITAVTAVLTRNLINRAVFSLLMALLVHLIFDRMWNSPDVVFWPALGLEFPEGHVPITWWLKVHFTSLPSSPLDLLGLAILITFVVRVIARRSAGRFLRTGSLT